MNKLHCTHTHGNPISLFKKDRPLWLVMMDDSAPTERERERKRERADRQTDLRHRQRK